MGGGLVSRCVGRVRGADVTVRLSRTVTFHEEDAWSNNPLNLCSSHRPHTVISGH